MRVTYYHKNQEDTALIATFGIHVPQLHGLNINNISIVKSKSGGWFINLPSFKNKNLDKWEKVVSFETGLNQNFLDTIKKAVEEYAKEKCEVIA